MEPCLTLAPSLAAKKAAVRPAAPPPTTVMWTWPLPVIAMHLKPCILAGCLFMRMLQDLIMSMAMAAIVGYSTRSQFRGCVGSVRTSTRTSARQKSRTFLEANSSPLVQ